MVKEAPAPVLRRRDWSVVALLTSVFCSSAAALAQTTVLGKQMYDLTHREFDLGLLGLAEFAPAALLVLVTGAVADRYDRRHVAALAALGEATVAAALALYSFHGATSPGVIFALVVAFGVGRAFIAPSARSLPADLMPPERLPWLVARYSATWQAAIVVGPVLGGFLYAREVWLPYAAACGLLVLSATALMLVRIERRVAEPALVVDAALETGIEPSVEHAAAAPKTERPGWHEAVEGLRFIRRRPILLGAISLDLFAVLFGGAIALLPAIAEDRLGVGAVGLGWLRAAGGIGAALVTVVLAARPINRRVGRTLLCVVAAFGAGTIVLGLTRSFAVAFVTMAVLSGADAVSVFIRGTLVPLATPEDKRGRVLAVENVFIGASNELGAFESGVIGQLFGTVAAVTLGGAATIAVAGTWWFIFPALRDVDGFPQGESDPA